MHVSNLVIGNDYRVNNPKSGYYNQQCKLIGTRDDCCTIQLLDKRQVSTLAANLVKIDNNSDVSKVYILVKLGTIDINHKRYHNYQAAVDEAKRMHDKEGKSFGVFRLMGSTQTAKPVIEWVADD